MSTPRKNRFWTYVLLLLLLLIGAAIALVLSLPARLVYERYAERVLPLRLQGVEGTPWNGRAGMAWYGLEPIGPVRWQIAPWSLLGGTAQGTLDVQGPQWQADTRFVVRRKRIELSAARGGFPAGMLAGALDIPSLQLLGDIRIDMQDVVIEDGLVKLAIGQMTWENVGVSGAAEARLGRVIVDFAPMPDGAILGTVRDDGGPLEAAGRIELRGLQFHAEVTLHARPGHDHIREALLYVGQRTLDGGSVLRVDGTIRQLY